MNSSKPGPATDLIYNTIRELEDEDYLLDIAVVDESESMWKRANRLVYDRNTEINDERSDIADFLTDPGFFEFKNTELGNYVESLIIQHNAITRIKLLEDANSAIRLGDLVLYHKKVAETRDLAFKYRDLKIGQYTMKVRDRPDTDKAIEPFLTLMEWHQQIDQREDSYVEAPKIEAGFDLAELAYLYFSEEEYDLMGYLDQLYDRAEDLSFLDNGMVENPSLQITQNLFQQSVRVLNRYR